MKRKLFLLSYSGYYNLGDDLMSDIMIGKNNVDFDVRVLSKRRYYNKKVNYIHRYNIIKYLFSISNNDILINLGGIFQDKTSPLSFFYYFIMNIIFLLRKGNISFINTDFSDVYCHKKSLEFLLKRSRLTVFRSKNEYNYYYKKYANIFYAPDIAFIYTFNKLKKPKKIDPYILISLRKHPMIKKLLKELKILGYKYKFLIMEEEKNLFKLLKRYFQAKDVFIYHYLNKNKIFDLIFNASNIITMRYHIGIIGLLLKKSIGIIEFSNKMKILNNDFGVNYYSKKKYIDNINKTGYVIDRNEIQKIWDNILMKITKINN